VLVWLDRHGWLIRPQPPRQQRSTAITTCMAFGLIEQLKERST
jgi:hypothetical protein